MKNVISEMLQAYEGRKLSRRQLVDGLALLAAGAGSASAAGFSGNTVNHVSVLVSDLGRTTEFYQKVLGCTVNKRNGNNQILLGKEFLVLRPGKPAGTVDHVAIGIDDFNEAAVTADLKARGVTPRKDSGDFGFHVLDPDGLPLQLISSANTGR